MDKLVIGSRGSKLALWQARWVKSELERLHAGLGVEIEIIKTTGDKLTEASLAQIGGKGVFTKEIEEALLDGRVDLAVHSLKDLPTLLPAGLLLAAVTEREDVRDALVVGPALVGEVRSLAGLPPGARVGTSSLRRAAQLRHLRPDLRVGELRGNVETRLRKLDEGAYDAIILAAAGLSRLGYGARVTERIAPEVMLSAVGQGALGIETRADDARTNALLGPLDHPPTRQAAEAERAVLRSLGGGCAVPIAALGMVAEDGGLVLEALVAEVGGGRLIRDRVSGPAARAEELGGQLARRLTAAGARELLPKIGRPLAGRRVIVTRAGGERDGLAEALAGLGAEIVACPTIEIREPEDWGGLDRAIGALCRYDWLILTSANGADFFLRRFDELGHRRGELDHLRVCAVGRKTAERAGREGLRVELVPESFTAEGLAAAFVESQPTRGLRLLLPTSQLARDEIRPALAAVGAEVDVVVAYRTVLPEIPAAEVARLIAEARADYVVFTSPSTVANLATLLGADDLAAPLAGVRVACIGPVTAEAAGRHGLAVDVRPAEHTAEALAEALAADGQGG